VTNWAAYDIALRQRGSLTVWFTEPAIAAWKVEPRCTRGGQPAVIVPPRSSAVPSATAGTAPTERDQNLQLIAERGRMGWQRASGYNWRVLVEADIGRYKRVIGDALRSRTGDRQTTEVAIATALLNRHARTWPAGVRSPHVKYRCAGLRRVHAGRAARCH
jgi:hypothetical protein